MELYIFLRKNQTKLLPKCRCHCRIFCAVFVDIQKNRSSVHIHYQGDFLSSDKSPEDEWRSSPITNSGEKYPMLSWIFFLRIGGKCYTVLCWCSSFTINHIPIVNKPYMKKPFKITLYNSGESLFLVGIVDCRLKLFTFFHQIIQCVGTSV